MEKMSSITQYLHYKGDHSNCIETFTFANYSRIHKNEIVGSKSDFLLNSPDYCLSNVTCALGSDVGAVHGTVVDGSIPEG